MTLPADKIFLLFQALSLPLVAYFITQAWIRWAHRRALLDAPGKRRSHQFATPTGAGLALLVLWCLWLLAGTYGQISGMERFLPLAVAALGLSLVGWLDDRHGLPIAPRLLAQFAAMGLLLYQCWPLPIPEQGMSWLAAGLLVFAGVWYINAFNFMDGIDGMATQQALFTFGFLAWLGFERVLPGLFWPAFLLCGLLLGFLPHNWSPARVFMGDAGSLPLGFLSVALLLQAWREGVLQWPAALMLLSLFNLDAFFTLVKRWFSNKRCYTPHREHLYQWMARAGFSHGQVSGLYAAVNVLLILPFTLWLNRMDALPGVTLLLLAVAIWAVVWWRLRQRLLITQRNRA